MAEFNAEIIGLDDFYKALARNPQLVISESKKFIQRGIAKYKSGIINNPWRVGMTGGGAPVLTGNLRDTHLTYFTDFQGMIFPSASYAKYIHPDRPWLDYVYDQKMSDIEKLEKEFADALIKDLSR